MRKLENLGLVPLLNFGQINDNIFRSAQPRYNYQFEWLRDIIGIEVLVDLRSENNIDDRVGVEHGFEVFDVNIPDHHAPSLEDVERFREFYEENKGRKILIHCAHGQGRTTTFSVLVRLFEGWTLDQAIQEQESECRYHFKHPKQLEFLREFVELKNEIA